jgi:hypothetical protein
MLAGFDGAAVGLETTGRNWNVNSIQITIYWNPKDRESAQDDIEAIVAEIENISNSEPKIIKNELGLIHATCIGLKTVEGYGQ